MSSDRMPGAYMRARLGESRRGSEDMMDMTDTTFPGRQPDREEPADVFGGRVAECLRWARNPASRPPENGKSPLYDAPDEFILEVLRFLCPPLYVEPTPGSRCNVLAFASACKRFRALAMPYAFCSESLPRGTQANLRGRNPVKNLRSMQHLKEKPMLYVNNIRALWVDVPQSESGDGGVLWSEVFSEAIAQILAITAPRLQLLALRNFKIALPHASIITLASNLRILDLDDGFVGDRQVASAVIDSQRLLANVKVFFCSVDTFPEASAVPFALLRITRSTEKIVIRGYHERFAAGLFHTSLWSTLRILALDAGNTSYTGLESLFKEFHEYSKHHACPLEEVAIESRRPEAKEFSSIIESLQDHKPLRKLSLMVVPTSSPVVIDLIAGRLPQLEELHLVCLASAWMIMSNPASVYGKALSKFPKLKHFGWNGLPTIERRREYTADELVNIMPGLYRAVLQPCKTIETFTLWRSFGSTEYYGQRYELGPRDAHNCFERHLGDVMGKTLEAAHDAGETVTFFPTRESLF